MNWPDDYLIPGIEPYHVEKAGIIYCADCRDILPRLPKVDLVLTDPPYGVNKEYSQYEDSPQAYQNLLKEIIPLIFAISEKRLITCGINNVWKWPEADWIIGWFKSNSMTRSAIANANVWEPVLVYGCKNFGVDGRMVPIIPQSFHHPCPKPLKLFTWLLSRQTADIILDPFLGSGTTAVAAKELGRRFIGIEISKEYCQIAVKRLRQGVLSF